MKTFFPVLICCIFGIMSGCVTTSYDYTPFNPSPFPSPTAFKSSLGQFERRLPPTPLVYSDDRIDIQILFTSPDQAALIINNKTDRAAQVVWDSSSVVYGNGKIERMVPTGVKYKDSNLSIPVLSIPPETSVNIGAIPSGSILYVNNDWIVNNWVWSIYYDTKFMLCYRIDGADYFATITSEIYKNFYDMEFNRLKIYDSLKLSEEMRRRLAKAEFEEKKSAWESQQPKIIDHMRLTFTYWHILFISAPEYARTELINALTDLAIKKHGPNARLFNIRYNGAWNPLSLVLYLSMLGFVEDATVEADIVI